ncbi:hypothetical protein GCM10011414_10080 [Croceivirga lutea]|uniref:O-antigen ligase family protein n=1 Tax=Croceivirga lutea TaxID=1775167 RepID=UPI00163B060F|nr:hypothetical protein [Croceivirga lutea]GGG42480.1 hypothetical protein GCM10011414_10080 [Croceivirga lutea]
MIKQNASFLLLTLLYAVDPFNIGFVFGYLLLVLIILDFKNSKKYLDNFSLLLLVFSAIYSVFYAFNPGLGSQFILIYLLIPITFYIVGKRLYNDSSKSIQKFKILFLIGIFLSIPSITSVWIDIFKVGYVTLNRNVPNIWTNRIENATNMAGPMVMNMGILGILLIGYKKISKKFLLLGMFVLFFLSLACIIRLGSRTHIALALFAIVVGVLYRFKKQNFKQNIGMFILLFILINLGFSYVSLSSDSDILSSYAGRMESKTHGANTAGGRTERWVKSLEYMFKEPLGWDLNEFGFAHNLWFDTLRVGGLLAFIFLLILTIRILSKMYTLYQIDKKINIVSGQLLIYIVCFLLLFFVEPILEGYFTTFTIFCLILGYMNKHLEFLKNSSKTTQENTGI